MKKRWIVMFVGFAVVGCTNKENLSEQQAATLIRQQMNYPKAFAYDVFCADPEYSKKAIDAGLETSGMVRVKRTQKLSEIGKPLIEFTDKAQPYLLAVSTQDQQTNIQKVKIAEEDLQKISKITMDEDGESATVEYTTGFENKTPFAALLRNGLQTSQPHTVYLTLSGNEWKLKNRKD